MSGRDTFQTSVKSANVTKAATLTNNEMTRQATIDAARTVVGFTVQGGNNVTLAIAIRNGNQAKRDADYAAEQVRQATVDAAREALRAAGDLAPV